MGQIVFKAFFGKFMSCHDQCLNMAYQEIFLISTNISLASHSIQSSGLLKTVQLTLIMHDRYIQPNTIPNAMGTGEAYNHAAISARGLFVSR